MNSCWKNGSSFIFSWTGFITHRGNGSVLLACCLPHGCKDIAQLLSLLAMDVCLHPFLPFVKKCIFFFLFKIVNTIADVPFCPLPSIPGLAPPSLWPSPHSCLSLWVMHVLVCSLANSFTFSHLFSPPPPPLIAVRLFHESFINIRVLWSLETLHSSMVHHSQGAKLLDHIPHELGVLGEVPLAAAAPWHAHAQSPMALDEVHGHWVAQIHGCSTSMAPAAEGRTLQSESLEDRSGRRWPGEVPPGGGQSCIKMLLL